MGATGCDAKVCGPGQRCEEEDGDASCVDNTCEELDCKDLTECVPAPGGGNVCESIACGSDVECSAERFCDGEKCVADVCTPEARHCDGGKLLVCDANGGGEREPYECGSAGYFESSCAEASAACTCEGDWDCPEYTVCEVGICKGTGFAPTCTLPPSPFEDVLPQREFRWGGENAASPDAMGKAFPWSAQVVSTPLVVNLDDDNADGLVNELDFPEIVFITYHGAGQGGTPFATNGIVRAVHGGGPKKGQDFFALCGRPARPAMSAASYSDENGGYWSEGGPVLADCNGTGAGDGRANALARPAGALAAGDLDGDGLPEIVVALEGQALQILDHRGEVIFTSSTGLWPGTATGSRWGYPLPAIANLDFAGLPEIVVGNRVFPLSKEGGTLRLSAGVTAPGTTGAITFYGETQDPEDPRDNAQAEVWGPAVCLADLRPDLPGLELVAGPTLYQYVPGATALTPVWSKAPDVSEAFCAVADVLGKDPAAAPGPENPLDGVPEVVLIADGRLVILAAQDGAILRDLDLKGGTEGGAPNIDDFDGDGFPEIATALANFYTVIDLQEPVGESCPAWPELLSPSGAPPGATPVRDPGGSCKKDEDCNAGAVCNPIAKQCVCLHNGWSRDTEDDSSRATSSSIFDFNGDGAAEVVYNDECYFRVYDGATGGVYLAIPSLSRTIVENPVVADVDNDGNAEILFVQNNERTPPQCSETALDSWPSGNNDVPNTSLPNGIDVWGDPSDVWVAARRVWNQHAYHVTNVTESGAIPLHEPESWKPLNGRLYNTYRSQPRNYGVAPDLSLVAIQVTSPDVACGEITDAIRVALLIKNEGDLRVGPGVVIEFSGVFEDPDAERPLVDANGQPITVTLDKSLEPGATTLVTIDYQAGSGERDDLPVEVHAVIDKENRERECDEDDNEIVGTVEEREDLPELVLAVSNVTCDGLRVRVENSGALPAEDILVRVYAGDPSQGGQSIAEETLSGPIEPGESETVELDYDLSRNVTLYVVIDPDRVITECNDANNQVESPIQCAIAK